MASRMMRAANRSSLRSRLVVAPSRVDVAARALSSSFDVGPRKSLVTGEDGVHQTMKVSKSWRNKPLFRRQGDIRFKTGLEAANLLVQEAMRRDAHKTEFIEAVQSTFHCLAPIFERNPKYAFIAKTLMEPDRLVQFRVAWTDDTGVVRMNRGYRIQYNSALGPYEGPLHLGSHLNNSVMKTLGFETLFTNAVTGYDMGAAVGGSDFHPLDKSETELQRFCQSFVTELAKYVGPDQDHPWMGMGVGPVEMGYLFGQYKRIAAKATTSGGRSFMSPAFSEASGYGVVHYANELLMDKGDSLQGKRVLIIGGGKVARSVAAKLLQFGAIPLTFSDASGFVYEPKGFSLGQLRTIHKIKEERGALLGRYIISSTTAKFNEGRMLDIPCDYCIPCGAMGDLDESAVEALADNGCQGVVEGGHSCVTPAARKILKKRGLLYGPHNLTLSGSGIVHSLGGSATDELLAEQVARIYQDVKATATEFNARGDLYTGANILGFLRIANVMETHGAV